LHLRANGKISHVSRVLMARHETKEASAKFVQ
jgi:hypothetical protein